MVTIGDVAEVKNGTTPSRSCPDYWNGTIPWLPTGKVNERFILSSDEFITEQALAKCSLGIIPAGSTLIAMIGQGQTRGKAARLEINSCINQNFGAVIPGSGVDSLYLFYQLDANYEQLRGWSHGTNQHALNCALIKSFRVRMPTLERQSEIAKELHATELAVLNAERREEKSASFLKSLREVSLKTDEVS